MLEDEAWALPGRSVELSARDEQAIAQLMAEFDGSVSPRQPDELFPELKLDRNRARQLLDFLTQRGDLTSATGVYFSRKVVAEVIAKLHAHLLKHDGVTVSDFNKLAGTSRKYGVPLLHILAQDGMLVRDGDVRRLNPKWSK